MRDIAALDDDLVDVLELSYGMVFQRVYGNVPEVACTATLDLIARVKFGTGC